LKSVTPLVSRAARPPTVLIEATNERGERLPTAIAGEVPLTLYVDKRELVTLMTMGCEPEALALGYLRNQRLARSVEEIASIQVDWETEACAITSRSGLPALDSLSARRTVTTGCGQGTVFGDLIGEIEAVRLPRSADLSEATLYGLLEAARKHDSIYKQAGGVHGCALAEDTRILYFIEDVGRHNAVDAIAGRMWLDGVEGADKIFYTTGRLTSEMVIKAAQMGVPFLVSRSGLTQMGYEIARRVGLTMIGRAQGRHYLLYTGAEHFRREGERASAA
jgi:FdhD protein